MPSPFPQLTTLTNEHQRSECLTKKGWFAKNEKIKFAKWCYQRPPVFNLRLFVSCQGLVASGKGSRAGGEGFKGYVRL